jgi:hypothetical protein
MGMRIVIDIMDDGAMFIGEDPDGPQLLEEEEAMEEAEEQGMMDGEAEEPEDGEEEDQEPVTEPVANERELMMRLKDMIANATAGADAEDEKAFEAGYKKMRGENA